MRRFPSTVTCLLASCFLLAFALSAYSKGRHDEGEDVVACYAPFARMYGGMFKVESPCGKDTTTYRLVMDKWYADRLINIIQGSSVPGEFNPEVTRLVLENAKREKILLMDVSGGVRLGKKEFAVNPSAFLIVNYELDRLVERQVASDTDAVTNKDSVVLLAKGFLRRQKPDGHGVFPIDWNHARFTAKQDKLEKGVWKVTCADGKNSYVVEIARRDGRLIVMYNPKNQWKG